MAKTKDTPTLPGSSRMQMPSTSVSASSIATGKKSMSSGKAIASNLVGSLKGKTGMKGSNPYC